MKKSVVKHKLRNDVPVLVNKICYFNADLAEMIGSMGFDCLWICNEHGTVDASLLKEMVRAARVRDMDCVVRTGENGFDDLIRILEMGTNGLMIPHIRNAEQAQEIVRRAKFPPIGQRGIDGIGADAEFGALPIEDYLKQANDETFIVAQIENIEALANVDEIAHVKGIDVLFIGPADLSLSMGIPGQCSHPDIIDAIKKVVELCKTNGAVCGTPYINAEHCKRLMDMGVKYFTGTSDFRILSDGFASFKDEVKSLGFSFRG